MADGDTLVNGLIGAVVSVVAGAVPLSPLVGGAVAGYLQGGDRSDGLRVGAVAGVFAFLAGGLVVVLMIGFVGILLTEFVPPHVPGWLLIPLFLLVLTLSILYFVGLSALGGWLGNYLRYDTDVFE